MEDCSIPSTPTANWPTTMCWRATAMAGAALPPSNSGCWACAASRRWAAGKDNRGDTRWSMRRCEHRNRFLQPLPRPAEKLPAQHFVPLYPGVSDSTSVAQGSRLADGTAPVQACWSPAGTSTERLISYAAKGLRLDDQYNGNACSCSRPVAADAADAAGGRCHHPSFLRFMSVDDGLKLLNNLQKTRWRACGADDGNEFLRRD